MDGMFTKKHHRKVQEPQLAAMVDVFSLLIVFLVLGTVFNVASVMMPEGMRLPKSISREAIDVTHQIAIQKNEIIFDFLKQKVSPAVLFSTPENSELEKIKSAIKGFLAQNQAPTKKNNAKSVKDVPSQLTLNVVADREVPFKLIFDVVKLCREAGFQAVLFITEGK